MVKESATSEFLRQYVLKGNVKYIPLRNEQKRTFNLGEYMEEVNQQENIEFAKIANQRFF